MIRAFGEGALLVEVASAAHGQALAASLRADPPPGVLESVPGLASVLVEIDPLSVAAEALEPVIVARMADLDLSPTRGRVHTIPVAYDGADLDEVAAATGLTTSEVVARHAAVELSVLFCGFAPGFAYLGNLPQELRIERLATPRTTTPAGSVAIAGSLTGIYPADLPGGWRVIGRTDVTLFDPRREPPVLLMPGDRVRFEPR